ncbi:hypothetical protein LE181_16605, partial [Streptomyces sp. SCA3-4]|nr:hypothetical protein [Streptomyces sichuanensis]
MTPDDTHAHPAGERSPRPGEDGAGPPAGATPLGVVPVAPRPGEAPGALPRSGGPVAAGVSEPGRPDAGALGRLACTRSAPGDVALLLDGAHSRRLVLLKSLLTRLERRPDAVPADVRERFEAHWRLLERAEAQHPRAVRDTLGYPSVGTWLTRALTAPDGDALARCLGHLGPLAAAAALRAGGPFALDLPAPAGRLVLP